VRQIQRTRYVYFPQKNIRMILFNQSPTQMQLFILTVAALFYRTFA